MESFKVENLSFAYPESERNALNNINFTITQGEFILLCGKSGCGKTTLLRLLKTALSPYGEMSGEIYFNGKNISEYKVEEQAAQIGFVMQNPDNQIVTDKVWHELAFGLESLGVKQNEIRARVSEMASFFGIQSWFYKNVTELSGGQKQLLNLASVMVMQPSVLILDEPTSQLDPIAASDFLNTLEKINRELGTTIILTEHRLEDVYPVADRVLVMDEGEIIADETPEKVGEMLMYTGHEMCKALPTPVIVHGSVKNELPCPLTVREGRKWLEKYSERNIIYADRIPEDIESGEKDTVIDAKDIWFRYEKNLSDIIKGLSLKVFRGELFCLVGGNGSGKTTLLSVISGLKSIYRGDIKIKGEKLSKIPDLYNGLLGVLPQNPQSLFVKKSVYEDLAEMLTNKKYTAEEKKEKIINIAELCRIVRKLESHPYDLSGGEQQRVALAKILLKEPEILILDEPTKGMDAHFKEEFANILLDLKQKGVTVIMVSHDIEFCAAYADRCAMMFDGDITSVDSPRNFFKGKNFYTTSANRMARTKLPDAVLANDIILACGGENKRKEIKKKDSKLSRSEKEAKSEEKIKVPEKKNTESGIDFIKRTVVTCFMIFFLIPLTVYVGYRFLGDRKYYFICLMIILETIVPFCMLFETRKPQAREVVVISVLCVIGVAGRMAFYYIPQFKPVVAIVIISGICFGGETGFLVGVIIGFVSNFFFGQGAWAPWQMFAFGIIGFVSGILFKSGFLPKGKLILCAFGFLSTYIIYGGIMNPASLIISQSVINKEMLISAFVAGIPFDLIHAFSTAFFLWFISDAMIEKIERIKIKYGLIK